MRLKALPNGTSRLVMAGIWIAGLASIAAITLMVVIAIEKIRSGHGIDTYRTVWLVQFNWIGFMIFLAIAAVALCIGLYLRWRELREIRALQAKYSTVSPDRPA